MQQNLKQLAKELFLREKSSPEHEAKILAKIEKCEIVDKRHEGWFCYCQKFCRTEMMTPKKDTLGFPKAHKDQIWLVNSHYDGCQGWD